MIFLFKGVIFRFTMLIFREKNIGFAGLMLGKNKIRPWVVQYTLGLPPTQDASHHQDYYIFSRESQPKPSFNTGILGGGVDPKYTSFSTHPKNQPGHQGTDGDWRFKRTKNHGNPSYRLIKGLLTIGFP